MINKIYLNLANASNWIAEDGKDSSISGAYEQKQNNQPKVIWNINCIPTATGIKSLTPAIPLQGLNSPPLTELFPIKAAELNIWLDSEGVNLLSFMDSLSSDLFQNSKVWILDEAYSGAYGKWRILLNQNTAHSFQVVSTIFQTQTLHVIGFNDSLGSGISATGDPLSLTQVFSYDHAAKQITIYRLTGISYGDPSYKLLGITSFQNYLVFWSKDTIYYSNPIDFTDFTPSIGGGGSTKIAEAKGNILRVVPNPQGLVIYCERNIVHAAFSGDATNPWVFVEVPDSLGVLQYETFKKLVTWNETAQIQYAVTTSGLGAVATNGMQLLPGFINEFINNLSIEYKPVDSIEFQRSASTLSGIYNNANATTKVRNIKLIGQYLIMTVSLEGVVTNALPFQEINLIYNTGTNQVMMFEGDFLDFNVALNKDGKVIPDVFYGIMIDGLSDTKMVMLNMAQGTDRLSADISEFTRLGEFVVGDLQVSRDRLTVIHSVKLDGRISADSSFNYDVDAQVRVYAEDTLGATNPSVFTYNPADGTYYGYAEGKDLFVEVKGSNYYLTGMEVGVETGGYY